MFIKGSESGNQSAAALALYIHCTRIQDLAFGKPDPQPGFQLIRGNLNEFVQHVSNLPADMGCQ